MNIQQFIKDDYVLSQLHYATVYQTIVALISKGVLSMDDLQTPKNFRYKIMDEICVNNSAKPI